MPYHERNIENENKQMHEAAYQALLEKIKGEIKNNQSISSTEITYKRYEEEMMASDKFAENVLSGEYLEQEISENAQINMKDLQDLIHLAMEHNNDENIRSLISMNSSVQINTDTLNDFLIKKNLNLDLSGLNISSPNKQAAVERVTGKIKVELLSYAIGNDKQDNTFVSNAGKFEENCNNYLGSEKSLQHSEGLMSRLRSVVNSIVSFITGKPVVENKKPDFKAVIQTYKENLSSPSNDERNSNSI